MAQTETASEPKPKTQQNITGVFFGLHQLTENNPGGYEWVILQITVKNNKITDIAQSPASVKEVTANRLATMLQNGETLDSLR